jgi:hypothetical protein
MTSSAGGCGNSVRRCWLMLACSRHCTG